MRTRKWLAVALMLAVTPAFGQVYQCKDAAGKKMFSDVPCGGDAKAVNVQPSRGGTPDGWRDTAWERQLNDLKQRERTEAANDQRLREIREMNRPLDNLAAERKTRRCSELRARLDKAEATMRNGAVHWLYNDAKSSIPALQNQIARDC